MNIFKFYFSLLSISLVFIFLFVFIILYVYPDIQITINDFPIETKQLSSNSFVWPTPGYTTITSQFGYRKAPTARSFYIPFRNRYRCSFSERIL